ncbi:exosome nuclease subunit [Podochytrium sp. JEL0797]|nr:exosome nuclease subunit [Podochytrium sp. JEL0797]
MSNNHQTTLDALAATVASSGFLVTKELSFHVAASPEAAASLSSASSSLLSLLNASLRCVAKKDQWANYASVDDVHDRFKDQVDVVDGLLEKTDAWLDRVTTAKKPSSHSSHIQIPTAGIIPHTTLKRATLRPQLAFTDPIDNTSSSPFLPILTEKHNAKTPLVKGSTAHPYEHEINSIEFPAKVLTYRPEIMYGSLEETPFTFVDTPELFDEMMPILMAVDEIAVDLEHHDYRSFQGFTCLIQLSTRKEDYIIDALALRSKIPQLNQILSNPNVVKLFHGAESDIVWLQRDFGCYVVGLFDTYHASHVLELEGHGLAFLLQYYCGVATDKKYQTADWRVRPLSKEMMKYARIDTHYLLYIYDRMRNEILEKDLETKQPLRVVLERSAMTSLNVYKKEVYDAEEGEGPNGWAAILRKNALSLTPIQLAVFKALHAWRDRVARIEDESPRYVCLPAMLVTIAASLPTDLASLSGCCHPMMPNLMKVYAQDVLVLIQKAKVEEMERVQGKEEEAMKVIQELSGKATPRTPVPAVKAHTRFDAMDTTDSTTAQQPKKTALRAVPTTTTPSSKPAASTHNIIITLKPITSTAFNTHLSTSIQNGPAFSAKQQAETIRASLFLVPPTFAQKRPGADDLAAPHAKRAATTPAVKKVTMETMVPMTKAQQHHQGGPTTVSQALKAAQAFDEEAMKEKRAVEAIPALPGSAYVYPVKEEELVPLIGSSGGGKRGVAGGKVFNPYGEVKTDVKSVGTMKGPKAGKGKSTSYKK